MRLSASPLQDGGGRHCLRRGRVGCALVAAVVVVAHLNALGGGFVFDDRVLVVGNPTLRSARFIPRILGTNLWAFLGRSTNYYRPLPPLLLMAVAELFGLRPAVFHAVSLILHAAAACLVTGLARRLLQTRAEAGEPVWGAILAGLLFGVHPVNTESVAWISGLVDVLGTFFSLLALYAHVRADGASAPWRWRLGACCAFALALLSKEPAVAIFPVLLALDLTGPRDRRPGLRDALARWIPLVAVCAGYLAVRVQVLGGLAPARYGPAGSAGDGLVLLSRYLEKLLLPVHLSVVPEIPAASSLSRMELLRVVSVLAVGVGLAVLLWRRGDRAARTGLLLAVLPLAPAIYAQALNRPELLANRFAERHLYLSTAGWALTVASVTLSAARRSAALRWVVTLSAAGWVLVFAAGTAVRDRVWRDEVTLWTDAVAKSPGVAEAHFKLGIALLERGDAAAGQRELRAGAGIDPGYVQQLFARARDDERAGERRRGLAELRVVTMALPGFAEGHFQLGRALATLGDADAALAEYVVTLQLDPFHVEAALLAARSLSDVGRAADAVRVLETAARLVPDDARIAVELEAVRRGCGASRTMGAPSDR